MSFHAVGQAPLPNFYGPGPAGVPNPYSGRVHNYPTRYHGPIYTRPMYRLPERRNPIEWGGGSSGYSGVGCLPCAGYGDIPAAIPGWAWGATAPGSTDYQNALNAELAKLGYATIGVDGKLGGQTCGAVEVLTAEGVAVPVPAACYPSGGMLGPDGKKRMWTAAGGGKAYAHPERVSAPAPQQQTEQPKTAEEPRKVNGGSGDIVAPSPWAWGASNSGGAAFQGQINAALAKLGYATIGADGKLGGGTCGAVETLLAEGVPVFGPQACYPKSGGVKGPDGMYRMWTAAGGGKAYAHPARIGPPQEEPKKEPTAEEPKKVVVTADPCLFLYGQASELAKQFQQAFNTVLAANGYETIPVTGVFDAATAGAMKLVGTKDIQSKITACAWDKIQTRKADWPTNPPLPQKAKVAAAPKKKPSKAAPAPKKAAPVAAKHVAAKRRPKAAPRPVTCGPGFHVEGRKCVKDIVVAPIATHTRKRHGGGKKPAQHPAAAEASMFASPAVWVGSAIVLGGIAWFAMKKKAA